MRIFLVFMLAAFTLVQAQGVLADEEKKQTTKPPVHNPEWTNPNTSDPGVDSTMDELQKIVVLCATDHESEEFRRAWSAYVGEHKLSGGELEERGPRDHEGYPETCDPSTRDRADLM